MTKLQKRFAEEYVVDLKAGPAYRRAGGTAKNAYAAGCELLTNPNVAAKINELQAERSERTKIDADWVLTQLAEMFQADISDIIDENGAYLPIHEWPPVWRRMLNAMDVEEIYDGRGKDREFIGNLKKIKFIDRMRTIENIGRHVGVQAFSDKLEVSGSLAEQLKKARDRAGK